MDVYVMAKQWMWKFAYPRRAERRRRAARPGQPAGAAAHDLAATSSTRSSSPTSASSRTCSPAATPRPGSRRPSRAATRSSAPSTAAPGTRRCGARSSCMQAPEFDQWLLEQQRGARRRASTSGGDRRSERSTASIVEYGQAGRHGRRAASSATRIDGAPHIGPTWLDLYQRRKRPRERRDRRSPTRPT